MADPKKDADKRRADAKRARRLATNLSNPADQDRLKQYADELDREASKLESTKRHPAEKEKPKP
jgi:hypothetical protein